jgi:hypothetical protein
MVSEHGLLFIEPRGAPSAEPVVDELTRKMAKALNRGRWGVAISGKLRAGAYRGHHTCSCGAQSTNQDCELTNLLVTNFLAVHYLAYHRDEVPEAQLQKVAELLDGEAEPTWAQLHGRTWHNHMSK